MIQNNLNDLYREVNQEFHPIIDYVIGLQLADKLSNLKTKYEALKLSQMYLISIKKDNNSELNFYITNQSNRVDIESINSILPKNIDEEVENTGLEINKPLTVYDQTFNYFYLSLSQIVSHDDILKLKHSTSNII